MCRRAPRHDVDAKNCGVVPEVHLVDRTGTFFLRTRVRKMPRLCKYLSIIHSFVNHQLRPYHRRRRLSTILIPVDRIIDVVFVTAMPPEAQAKLARPLREFGRHVFVYSHLHTGQTVYSLNRVLNVSILVSLARCTRLIHTR